MNQREINALMALLDDEDESIYQQVRQKLIDQGKGVYSYLVEHSLFAESQTQHQRLVEVYSTIHLNDVKKEFGAWLQEGAIDLLRGYYLVAWLKFPDLDFMTINHFVDKMKLDVWLKLNFNYAPMDNVRVLNEVFFGKYKFQGNQKDYFSTDNSFVNKVIETRRGNPISLAILYSCLAQKLYLPILGVNLPQHFVLAYKEDTFLENDEKFNNKGIISHNLEGEVLFYINVFSGGGLFSKLNIDRFLKLNNLPFDANYYEPCSNKTIIMRVLRNLIVAFEKKENVLFQNHLKEVYDYLDNSVI